METNYYGSYLTPHRLKSAGVKWSPKMNMLISSFGQLASSGSPSSQSIRVRFNTRITFLSNFFTDYPRSRLSTYYLHTVPIALLKSSLQPQMDIICCIFFTLKNKLVFRRLSIVNVGLFLEECFQSRVINHKIIDLSFRCITSAACSRCSEWKYMYVKC